MTLTHNSTLNETKFKWHTDHTTIYQSRVINYGRFAIIEREVSLKVNTDGKSLFDCPEDKDIVNRLADILYSEVTLPRPTDEKVGVWRGCYDANRGVFAVSNEHIKHVLFVSNANLRPIATVVGCDYIISRDINALVISIGRLRMLSRSLGEHFVSSDTLA